MLCEALHKKGKVERFNRVVDSFLAEVRLDKPTTLEDFNAHFQVWLAECYQTQPHSARADAPHPEAAYRADPEPLRFVDIDTLTAAFQRVVSRKVDKTGYISFLGQKYEVGVVWVGSTVDVIYDPTDTQEVTIEAPDVAPWTARPLVMGEHTGTRSALPDHIGTSEPHGSRVLKGAAQQHAARRAAEPPAVSFQGLTHTEEGPSHV